MVVSAAGAAVVAWKTILGADAAQLDDTSGLSYEQHLNLAERFRAADQTGSGRLGLMDLRALWAGIFRDAHPLEVEFCPQEMLRDLGRDQFSGIVSYPEFVQYLSREDTMKDLSDLIRGIEEDWGGDVPRDLPAGHREWLYAMIESSDAYSSDIVIWVHIVFNVLSQAIIITNIVILVVESTIQRASDGCDPLCWQDDIVLGNAGTDAVDSACVCFFIVELAARVYVAPSQRALWMSGFTWIDLLAILPFIVEHSTENAGGVKSLGAMKVLRFTRLFRVLRVAKMGRHSAGIQLMVGVMRASGGSLSWLILMMVMTMILFASLAFYFERDGATFRERPEVGQGAWFRPRDSKHLDAGDYLMMQSIPDAMWWSLVTLTTAGYGDQYPVTTEGRIVAFLAQICGLLILAYPVTLLGGSFQQAWAEYNTDQERRARRTLLRRQINQRRNRRGVSPRAPAPPLPCAPAAADCVPAAADAARAAPHAAPNLTDVDVVGGDAGGRGAGGCGAPPQLPHPSGGQGAAAAAEAELDALSAEVARLARRLRLLAAGGGGEKG